MHDIWITTDAVGFIVDCSAMAPALTGYTARGARGRWLPHLFIRDRPHSAELFRAAQGEPAEREAMFRPSNRKPLLVRFRIERVAELSDGTLRWTFDVRWPLSLRMPRGIDRRQLITLWRRGALRCVFVPGGSKNRRLFVCAQNDEVIHEEVPSGAAAAYARASELHDLAVRESMPP